MPIIENKNAIPQLTAMFISGMIALSLWVGFRWPYCGSEMLMSSIFSTFICYLIPFPELRFWRLCQFEAMLAGFQLGVAMLLEQKFLLLIWFFAAIFLLLRFYHNRPLAIVVTAMGSLTVAQAGGWEAGVHRGLFFLTMAPLEFLVILLVHYWMGFTVYRPPLKPIWGPMNNFGAFQFAGMMTLGLFIYQFFQMPYGDWIIYTIALVHMGGVFGGTANQRGLLRFFLGPLGIYAGFLYMAIFTWFAYQMAYLVVIFGVVGFYVSIRYGKYAYYALIFMVFFVLIYDFTNPETREFSMLEMYFSRCLNIGIGVAIALLGEPDNAVTLAPESTLPYPGAVQPPDAGKNPAAAP